MSPEWGGERRILGDHVVFKRDGGGGVVVATSMKRELTANRVGS